MKQIETNGITFLEHLAENSDWYCGTDFASGDLFEVEEVFKKQGKSKANRLVFVHHPDGRVIEPIVLSDNQYFGRPTEVEGIIYILIVDFAVGVIQIIDCGNEFERSRVHAKIPLSEVEDCYNLLLKGSPLMLTRQGWDDRFEIVWPEKVSFSIDENEAFIYRRDDKMVFSRWIEDPDYREEVVIREYASGKVTEVIEGSIFITPSGEEWVIK